MAYKLSVYSYINLDYRDKRSVWDYKIYNNILEQNFKTMRTIHTFFIAAAFLISILTACQNPSERAKGPYQKDYKDTAKKKAADSTAARPRVNPEDTVRKY
jgi:hypothetical protein